ncbi:hypothetical protein [uncultured Tenacibaculum sp.]|uniref:hypothetical protein n=1 Tax=uncultured Tenacibaculum sp. TaxID=174713 RepID=UPI00261C2925|nr:hypothetical protein [uncultured Tenacibaculum sp.]
MKKIVFTLAMFSIAMIGYAQTPVVQGADGKVGIGTTTPSAKLEVVHETNSGEVSKVGMTVIRNTQISANGTSYDTGVYSRIGSFSIPSGITDSGYRIGVNASSFAVSNNFAGILKDNVGVWARAGIHVATPGATIKRAVAVNAEILDNVTGTTIENAYGVFISTNGYNQSNVINRYDLYAGTAAAKNYFAGNVGVGVQNPKAKLHVANNITGQGDSKANMSENSILTLKPHATNSTNMQFAQVNNGNGMGIQVTNSSNTANWDIALNPYGGNIGIGTAKPETNSILHIKDLTKSSKITIETADDKEALINFSGQTSEFSLGYVRSDGSFRFVLGDQLNSNERMRIDSKGKVGIGTTTPSEKLEVYNSVTTPGVISLRSSRNDASYVDVGRVVAKQGTTEVSRIGMPRAGGTNTGFLTFWTKESNSSPLKESMRINEKGNVGIGTTDTKGFKLGVNGKIATTEVKVATYANWSDFVFEKEYKLPTLTQVENHIKEKGHLKDIPSAAEVKKEGFFLGEMDAKLLQKIEELTLYTIQQEKQLKRQLNLIVNQTKEIKELKSENKEIKKLAKEIELIKQKLK